MPGTWKVTTNHRHYPETASFPMAHIGNRYVLLEKNRLSDSTDVFPKYIIVRKLPNSTSAALYTELSMIVTELDLPNIIKGDNGLCYNSKEFQQFLQHYNITHQPSSPNHARSNGFVERMVGVAKKLMDKAGKEGKPWISGLFDYRVTPQSGSIASPLQLLTPAPNSQHSRCSINAPCTVPIPCWLWTALCGHLLSIVVAFAFTLVAVVAVQITLGNVVRVYPGTIQGLTFYLSKMYI